MQKILKSFDGVPIKQDNESKRNEKMVDEIMLMAPVRKQDIKKRDAKRMQKDTELKSIVLPPIL